MDDLAHELGMSKKTLYVHFPSKDAIVDQIIDCLAMALRSGLEAVTADSTLPFVKKLAAMIDVIGTALGSTSPHLLRDLQRFAPATYQKIEALRGENIPLYFGRLIRVGIAEGKVSQDLDPDFATQFWLHAIRGLLQPAALDRIHLTPKQTLEKAINLFFGGLLSPAGRMDYENPPVPKKKPKRAR